MEKRNEKKVLVLGMFCSVCLLTMVYLTVNSNPRDLTTSLKETVRQANAVFSRDDVVVEPYNVLNYDIIEFNKNKVDDFEVTFKNQSGKVIYTFYIENKSLYDAVLQEFKLPSPVCKGFAEDCEKVLPTLSYTLKYDDGSELKAGDILKGREKLKFILTLEYKENTNSLPSSTVDISNLGFELKYNAK